MSSDRIARLYIEFDADGRPYIRGTKEIENVTTQSGKRVTDTWSKAGQLAGKAAAAGIAVIGAAALAAAGATVKAAATFEYEMSRIKANANGTAKEMQALEATVIQLGKDTVFSAGQTAQAANELVKAGLSIGETMSALPGMLALASAGELDVAKAAEITANQLSVFNLRAEDAGSVADTLALAANRSTTEVSLLGDSMAMVGAVAANAGLTVQETAAALAELANNGIKGSDAGTSLKQMFMQLAGPSEKARDLMQEIGFAAYDSSGNLKDMDVIIGDLQTVTAGMTQEQKDFAFATIFGSDAVRAVNILVKEGAVAYRDMTAALSESGAAEEIAKVKMDNLKGSWEQFKGSIETAAIMMGTEGIPGLREFVDGMTDATNQFIDAWERMTGSTAWQNGGFEVRFDMASGTVMDTIRDLADQLVDKLATVDWTSVGSTLGQAVADAAGIAVKIAIEGVVPMVPGLVIGILEGIGKGVADLARDVVESGRETEPTSRTAGTTVRDRAEMAAARAAERDAQMALNEATERSEVLLLKQMAAEDQVAEAHQEVQRAAAELGSTVEEVNALVEAAAAQYTDIVDPLNAYKIAVEKTGEAADATSAKYDAAHSTLAAFLEELQNQIANWENYQANLEKLATTWGPSFGTDVIAEAAKIGPEFVAALVGADDPDLVRETMMALEATIKQDPAGLASALQDWGASIASDAGLSAALAWVASFGGTVTSELENSMRYGVQLGSQAFPQHAAGYVANHGAEFGIFGEAGTEIILPVNRPDRWAPLFREAGLPMYADGGVFGLDASQASIDELAVHDQTVADLLSMGFTLSRNATVSSLDMVAEEVAAMVAAVDPTQASMRGGVSESAASAYALMNAHPAVSADVLAAMNATSLMSPEIVAAMNAAQYATSLSPEIIAAMNAARALNPYPVGPGGLAFLESQQFGAAGSGATKGSLDAGKTAAEAAESLAATSENTAAIVQGLDEVSSDTGEVVTHLRNIDSNLSAVLQTMGGSSSIESEYRSARAGVGRTR